MKRALIEGLLFLSGEEGLTIPQIENALPELDSSEIRECIQSLREEYLKSEHGIELVEYASRFKFVTKEIVYPYGQRLFEEIKHPSLSQAAMETLAIIAYKQPITRVEIEEIRGVNCEMMLKKLQVRGLIEARERKDAIGKPLLYTVTDTFLDAFQLETLKELPALPEQEQDEDLFVQEEENEWNDSKSE